MMLRKIALKNVLLLVVGPSDVVMCFSRQLAFRGGYSSVFDGEGEKEGQIDE